MKETNIHLGNNFMELLFVKIFIILGFFFSHSPKESCGFFVLFKIVFGW